jgi:hypothetical protein
MPVKNLLTVAKVGGALLAMSAALSVAVVAAPTEGPAQGPQMRLVSTDTNEAYPFAAIVVNNQTYHVTEGDILNGVYVRHISPGRVTLSDDRVLVMEPMPGSNRAATHDEVAARMNQH